MTQNPAANEPVQSKESEQKTTDQEVLQEEELIRGGRKSLSQLRSRRPISDLNAARIDAKQRPG